MMANERTKFATCTFRLANEQDRERAMRRLQNAPVDPDKPLQCLIREEVKVRGLDANARMWVGPIKNIADQVWTEGRQYKDIVWHDFFKREFLPDEFDAELTKDGYIKWDSDPEGNKVLVGSTTQLTRKGFAIYLEQIHAFGANMGVQFSASPNEGCQ